MNKGFTLIELLVAISILAVAFGVVISSSVGIQKSSRDTQRKADLRYLQSALQQYYADQEFYPSSFNLSSDTNLTSEDGNPSPPTSSKTYLSTIPKDPNESTITPYIYEAGPLDCDNQTSKCLKYCLYASVETGETQDQSQCDDKTDYDLELIQP